METKNEIQKIEKQALNVFVSLAALVFAASLAYCYHTENFLAFGIEGGAVVLLSLLVLNTYKSFNKS